LFIFSLYSLTPFSATDDISLSKILVIALKVKIFLMIKEGIDNIVLLHVEGASPLYVAVAMDCEKNADFGQRRQHGEG
jgi:hypothetical protein